MCKDGVEGGVEECRERRHIGGGNGGRGYEVERLAVEKMIRRVRERARAERGAVRGGRDRGSDPRMKERDAARERGKGRERE